LIPLLLAERDLESIETVVSLTDFTLFQPFQLVAVDRGSVHAYAWRDGTLTPSRVRLTTPLLFTSSSLGDDAADAARRPLFGEMVVRAADSWLAGQLRFHDSWNPESPAFSVRMSRAGARTVSWCSVDVQRDRVAMEYRPVPSVVEQAA
jgi:hypothetical protein